MMEPWYESQMRELEGLEHGWNSYSAKPINTLAMVAVRSILSTLPSIVPTNRGGIQLEWHTAAGDYELVIRANGSQDIEGEE